MRLNVILSVLKLYPHLLPAQYNMSSVGLSEEKNPEYWKLIADAGELADRWMRLNLLLNTFKVPRLPFFGARRTLRAIMAPYQELQADTNRWLTRADSFFLMHGVHLDPDQDWTLNIMWTRNEIDRRISSMQQNKFIANYASVLHGSTIDHRQNFAIAIASFALSFAGLVWAVLAS